MHRQHRQGSQTVQVKSYPIFNPAAHHRDPTTATETMPPLLPSTGALLALPLQARRATNLSLQGRPRVRQRPIDANLRNRGMPIALIGPPPRTYGRTGLPGLACIDGPGVSIAIRVQAVAPTAIEPVTAKIICQIPDGMVSAAMPWVA